jgi:hypothetical protein|nr:MAG TPA: YopX protein [Caudoviricetes sp.]
MIPKFRAYDSGSLCRMYQPEEVMVGDGNIWIVDEDDVAGEWIVNNDLHLMQSTGLLDAFGTEIFEGDIVKRYKSPFFVAEWEYQIETVVKREACLLLGKKLGKNFATMSFGSPFTKSDLLEVIGNIYENPELLEEE